MKVFACRNQESNGSGLILVAAHTREEAFFVAAIDETYEYLCNGIWCKPDDNINPCISSTYPLDKWFEVKCLATDLAEAKVIIEDSYSE